MGIVARGAWRKQKGPPTGGLGRPYRQGATDLLTVLQAQQTLFSAEDQLAQTTLAHMQAVVHLFEALGGGWMEPTEERTQFAARQSVR